MFFKLLESLSHIFYIALHVVSSGAFPQPLSPKDEKFYFEKFKQHKDINARNKLVEHNLRLVAHIIKKYYRTVQDQEDLISIGTIGLIKAVNTFDYSKGARFSTYASRCIENEILMNFRSSKKQEKDISFSEPINVDPSGNSLTLADVVADDVKIFDDLSLKLSAEKLYRYMNEVLSTREKKIIEWRYGLIEAELTQREIAKILNISRSYVSRIETKALTKLNQRFEKGEKPKCGNYRQP